MTCRILVGDCREHMAAMLPESVHAIVTDPPYDLTSGDRRGLRYGEGGKRTIALNRSGFMGMRWDSTGVAFDPETWIAAYRVLKPGGHLLAFGGPRTEHRMVCAIEDAGFEIRDKICWLFGSGFPKSLDVSKAMDKAAGAQRERIGRKDELGVVHGLGKANETKHEGWRRPWMDDPDADAHYVTTPATDLARQWDGWGTALKPAMELICLARKPLIGTVAANVTEHGTGAINVDACRIGLREERALRRGVTTGNGMGYHGSGPQDVIDGGLGRWPANVVLDECAAELLDEQSGECPSGGYPPAGGQRSHVATYGKPNERGDPAFGSSGGGASRFFYTAKSSKSERNKGLGSTYTVKYNVPNEGGTELCEATVALLQRVTSDIPTVKWRIGESGASITALCPLDSLSITSTAISKIIGSKTLPWLTPSRTSEFTVDANSVTVNGGSHVASAETLSLSPPIITSESQVGLARGAERVASQMLLKTSDAAEWKPDSNFHATVKPVALMQWLVRLVCPPGGTVLDPFCGSGSTGVAADREGFDFIGIEQDEEYARIAELRIRGDCPMFANVELE